MSPRTSATFDTAGSSAVPIAAVASLICAVDRCWAPAAVPASRANAPCASAVCSVSSARVACVVAALSASPVRPSRPIAAFFASTSAPLDRDAVLFDRVRFASQQGRQGGDGVGGRSAELGGQVGAQADEVVRYGRQVAGGDAHVFQLGAERRGQRFVVAGRQADGIRAVLGELVDRVGGRSERGVHGAGGLLQLVTAASNADFPNAIRATPPTAANFAALSTPVWNPPAAVAYLVESLVRRPSCRRRT